MTSRGPPPLSRLESDTNTSTAAAFSVLENQNSCKAFRLWRIWMHLSLHSHMSYLSKNACGGQVPLPLPSSLSFPCIQSLTQPTRTKAKDPTTAIQYVPYRATLSSQRNQIWQPNIEWRSSALIQFWSHLTISIAALFALQHISGCKFQVMILEVLQNACFCPSRGNLDTRVNSSSPFLWTHPAPADKMENYHEQYTNIIYNTISIYTIYTVY